MEVYHDQSRFLGYSYSNLISALFCMFLLLFFLLGSDIGTHVYHEKASGTGILVVQRLSALNSNYLI